MIMSSFENNNPKDVFEDIFGSVSKPKYDHTRKSIGSGMYKHIVILTGEQYKELMSNLRDDNYSITKRLHKIASEVGYDPNAYGWYNSCVTPVDGQCIIVWNSYASCD